jgi:hypothetical protein
LGDTDSHPKIEVFVISRNAELAAAEADLSLVLVVLVGGNRPAISPAEVRAHLSSVYHISKGTTSVNAWIHRAYQGLSTSPHCGFDDAAGERHDPGGANGFELDRNNCIESASDSMVLEAELAARSSIVPPVLRAIVLTTCSSPSNDEDKTPPPIVQPQPVSPRLGQTTREVPLWAG